MTYLFMFRVRSSFVKYKNLIVFPNLKTFPSGKHPFLTKKEKNHLTIPSIPVFNSRISVQYYSIYSNEVEKLILYE